MRQFIALTLLLSISSFAETKFVLKEAGKKVKRNYELVIESYSLFWNSVNEGLEGQLYCHWIPLAKNKALLLPHKIRHKFMTKYTIKSQYNIYFNAETCEVTMGNGVIGRYYAGKCQEIIVQNKNGKEISVNKGFYIEDATVTINEIDQEITID